jgi:hypothetical protein
MDGKGFAECKISQYPNLQNYCLEIRSGERRGKKMEENSDKKDNERKGNRK